MIKTPKQITLVGWGGGRKVRCLLLSNRNGARFVLGCCLAGCTDNDAGVNTDSRGQVQNCAAAAAFCQDSTHGRIVQQNCVKTCSKCTETPTAVPTRTPTRYPTYNYGQVPRILARRPPADSPLTLTPTSRSPKSNPRTRRCRVGGADCVPEVGCPFRRGGPTGTVGRCLVPTG